MWKAIYRPLDLVAFDATHAGQTLEVLQNPTERFRREYPLHLYEDRAAWLQNVALILHCSALDTDVRLAAIGSDVWTWLLLPRMEQGEGETEPRRIPPHVYTLWDAHREAVITDFRIAVEVASYGPNAPLPAFASDALRVRIINHFLGTAYTLDDIAGWSRDQIDQVLILEEKFRDA